MSGAWLMNRLQSLMSFIRSDMTPCMSPLPQDGHLQDKSSPSLGLIQEETEVINSIMGKGVFYSYLLKVLGGSLTKACTALNACVNCPNEHIHSYLMQRKRQMSPVQHLLSHETTDTTECYIWSSLLFGIQYPQCGATYCSNSKR